MSRGSPPGRSRRGFGSLWAHMHGLWPRATLLPVAPFALWTLYCLVARTIRGDHVVLLCVVLVLAYGTVQTKRLFVGLFPMGLVAIFYDAMRLIQNVGLDESTVHVCDLRAAELRWFGIGAGDGRVTLQDYFQTHAHLAIDVLSAIPYAGFIPVVIGYAVYLYFKDSVAQQRFTWAFFLLNVAGFATYHVYPSAPPWYFHANGCVVDLAAHASEGPNLARVDALMGFSYFASFYGRASDVFGAVPSLHVAYPLVIVLEGWRRHGSLGRTLSVLFYLWMCFAAVYLDHHWVIDIVVGSVYALAAVLGLRLVFARFAASTATRAVAVSLGGSR